MDLNSKVAASYVRFSTIKQIELANKLKTFLKIDTVYVFDSVNHFKDATQKIDIDIRYLKSLDGKVAVLSYAAQNAFKTSNTYNQYAPADTVTLDSIGVYV